MRRSAATNLGRLTGTFQTSAAYFQRAALIAGLSFVFFLAMMIAFYVRQWPGYFGLATAFMVVNIFTLIGIWIQKKNVVRVHENGLSYRKLRVAWNDIERLKYTRASGLEITYAAGKLLKIPSSIDSLPEITERIRNSVEAVR
ncbi:MAG: hypothetical protein QUS14_09920 [Pyrinomonadaceae bacterium]|nr:hypothetical protein [Pyrinomonadaceae bacterium]